MIRPATFCVGLLFLCAALACGGSSAPPPQAAPTHQNNDELDKAIDDLAAQIVSRLVESQKSKVGINEFLTLKGETNDLGKFLSEELSTRIINSRKTQVVERRLLQKVLAEQEMGASQLVDDETAAKIGKLLGADTLCTGTLTDLGGDIKVNARLINAETAEVYGAASVDLPKSRAVLALLGGSGGMRPAFATGPGQPRQNVRQASQQPAMTTPQNPPPVQPQPQPAEQPARPSIVVGQPTRGRPAFQNGPGTPNTPPPSQPPPVQPNAPQNDEPTIFVGRAGDGPDTLTIHNKTKYCVRVWMNGRLLRVIDKTMEVPCIPDREKSYVRIGAFGEYRIQASGSATASPFKGIVGYDRKHVLSPQQKKLLVVLNIDDFYTVQ
jgi:curli biogenesis system outer membrane secretion channel CsgG